MKINWKLRLKNKVTLSALISAMVVFIYEVAGALGFILPVSQEQVLSAVAALLAVLVALGVIVDPTTTGVDDSKRAMGYDAPAPNVAKVEKEESSEGADHE